MILERRCQVSRATDPDRGTPGGSVGVRGEAMSREEHAARELDREGLRELDNMAMQDTLRLLAKAKSPEERAAIIAQHDAERALPRRRVKSSVIKRRNPKAGSRRTLTANRQKEVNADKNRAGARLPQTVKDQAYLVLTDPSELRQMNDELARVNGDIEQLDETTKIKVRRTEQLIGEMEREQRGEQIVYCQAEFPSGVNRSNWAGFVENQFPDDSVSSFDRFNPGSLHASKAVDEQASWRPVHQFRTARVGYFGKSGKGGTPNQEAGAILQRGVRYRKVEVQRHQPIGLPDGSTTHRDIIVWEEAVDG